MDIAFFGTPAFAAKILEKVVQAGHHISCIVTKPDKPVGRSLKLQSCAVKTTAEQLLPQVPVFQPEKCSTPEFAEVLRGIKADIFVVVAYGEIISQSILDIPPLGCINVHASLLPGYRGAAPIHRALINGEKESGISIIKLVRKMDAGDVLCKEAIPISIDMTFSELETALCDLGAKTLLQVLNDFKNNRVIATPQDHNLATFASKITPEECEIHWDRPALTIHNLIRGTSPHPGAWCYIRVRDEKKRLKVIRSKLVESSVVQSPGSIVQFDKNGFFVACLDGIVSLETVQLEGKPQIPFSEFVKGYSKDQISFS